MNCFTPLRAPLLTTPPAVSSWRASPRFFSGGFDVAEVFRYDRKAMTDFFGRFVDLYERLLRLPKPVVAAINGHAFAGGAARDVLPNGSTLSPTRALEVGLATELAAPEAVLQRACEHARALAAKPPEAFGAIKRSILAASGHAATATDREALEYFIDHWFSPEAEERKQALIASMQR